MGMVVTVVGWWSPCEFSSEICGHHKSSRCFCGLGQRFKDCLPGCSNGATPLFPNTHRNKDLKHSLMPELSLAVQMTCKGKEKPGQFSHFQIILSNLFSHKKYRCTNFIMKDNKRNLKKTQNSPKIKRPIFVLNFFPVLISSSNQARVTRQWQSGPEFGTILSPSFQFTKSLLGLNS